MPHLVAINAGFAPAVNSQQAKVCRYGTDYGGEYQHVLLLHSISLQIVVVKSDGKALLSMLVLRSRTGCGNTGRN